LPEPKLRAYDHSPDRNAKGRERRMPSFSAEERQLLNDSLTEFLGETYNFETWRKLTKKGNDDGYSRDAWAKYAELGWLGVALPESAGGAGGGMTELGIVMAGGGRYLVLEPLLGTVVIGAAAIEVAGTAAQQKLLAQIVEGKHTIAFAHSEPGSGYARDYVKTIARKDGAGCILDGEKTFALHANAADTLLVSARIGSDTGPISLFLVPRKAEGVALNVSPALDARLGAAMKFSGVKLSAAEKLGDGDKDQMPLIDKLIDRAVIATCADAVGAMASVTQQTVEYLKTRQQFGQALSKFQVLQHRLVDMSVSTEEARSTVHAALQALDENAADAQRAVWIAKVKTAQCARFVGGQAVQLHGGMGMTDELAIGHYYKRLTMNETTFGDGEWYLRMLGRELAKA
jgi:alkylation response protein AidB-like acyl-CoA dehydrogenase